MSDEHIERAQEFWRQYRFYILIALAMLLALIGGFTYRHAAQDSARAAANESLYALLAAAEEGRAPDAAAAFAALQRQGAFPELEGLAGFVAASLRLDDNAPDEAEALIKAAADASGDRGIQRMAALRRAEILINRGAHDDAVRLLNKEMPQDGRLRILFYERIGDAEFARDDIDAAKEAYLTAVQLVNESAPFYARVLHIKIGSLLSANIGEAAPEIESGDAPAQNSDAAQ